jgi:two-component system sensor histidine kinase KdpD
VLGLPLVTVALVHLRSRLGLSSVLLVYLITVLGIGVVGGMVPAVAAALAALLLANYYFTLPLHRFVIAERENLLALSCSCSPPGW